MTTLRTICRKGIPGYDSFATKGECWFDAKAAQKAVDFFPACLKHVEGAVSGKPFVLEPWQQAVIGNLFGWKRKDARGREIRRYRECLLYVPRKNGKSPLIAGLSAYILFCTPERGQQNYIAAADREQAGMLFRHLRGMVEQSPDLSTRCRVYGGTAAAGQSKSIVRIDDGSFTRIIAADGSKQHGQNPSSVIMDELHTQPNPELYDVLHTGMASENRAEPLFVSLTTADYDRPSVCNERHAYACQVRDGLIEDVTFLPVVYETKSDADWTSPDVWAACNPNLGVSVSLEYMRSECEKAQKIPRMQNEFKRLHLNMRTSTAESWLDLAAWDESDEAFDAAELENQPCWAGLDLASTTDLAAFAAVFLSGKKYRVLCHCWMPENKLREKSKLDRVNYDVWIDQGWITATPGARIDYAHIRQWIGEFGRKHEVVEIGADRWNATQILGELDGDGFTVFEFGQGYKDMSPAAKELEAAIAAREISANKNPVMRWAIGNVMCEKDAAGNVKPSKAKSTQRIDPVIALVMGLWRASLNAGRSCYESRELIEIG